MRVLACVLALGAGVVAAAPSFERFDLELGTPNQHIVLPGRFLAATATTSAALDDLAVVTASEENEREVAVYSLQEGRTAKEGWQSVRRWRLDERVIFVDAVTLADGTERLLVARRGRVNWLDLDSGQEDTFLELPSIYNVAPIGELPRVEVVRDMDGDDLDDIALADFDGYWIVRQRPDGGWHEPSKVEVTAGVSAGSLAWSYRPRRPYPIDFNGDRQADLAFWDRGELLVHLATADDYADALVSDLGLALQSDERVFSIAFGEDETEATTLWGMEDYNGDGIADIATQRVKNSGLLTKETSYSVHFGYLEDGRTKMKATPDAAFVSDGIQVMDSMDLQGDGTKEFMIITVRVSVARIIAALLTGSVPFDADLYAITDGEYPEEPSFSRRFDFEFSLSAGTANAPGATFADVTGDGIKDGVLVNVGKGLLVHEGTTEPGVISEQAHETDFETAEAVRWVEGHDFDRDGREDLLIHTGVGTARKGVVVLLSRDDAE